MVGLAMAAVVFGGGSRDDDARWMAWRGMMTERAMSRGMRAAAAKSSMCDAVILIIDDVVRDDCPPLSSPPFHHHAMQRATRAR